jgi:hypothetical protein
MKQAFRRVWVRLLRTLGYPGLVGLGLLVPALALAAWLPHLQQDTGSVTASLANQARAAAQRLQASPRAPSDGEITREFVASFPLLEQNAADLETILTAARLHQVMLLKGEYQLKAEPNAPFMAYTATFPIHSDYATVKDFSADVLTALPHVSMDELRMTRDAAGSTSLDAVVRFTFFYRSP